MMDRPTAQELLEAIAASLSTDVLPETSDEARHAVRVSANLARVLAREAALGPDVEAESRELLRALIGPSAEAQSTSADLAVDAITRLGPNPPTDFDYEAAAWTTASATVAAKLRVVRPGYADHDAAAEFS